MNLDYGARLQPASMKTVEWANRKLGLLAERIVEKYPDFFIYENKNPNRFPYGGQLCAKSVQSTMMMWTSTGLCIWPAACYIPKSKIMNFNNYNLPLDDYGNGIITDGDGIYFILPENYNDWVKLPKMSHTERILFVEDRMPEFIDKLIKDKMNIDKMLKETEIREAAAKYVG